jgi:Predicted nucleic acid-binding protein, consists of a PIN domain and a Zn-ribbon module
MMYICPECNSEVPSDSDFCQVCGRMVKKFSPSSDDSPVTEKICITCGNELLPNDLFCRKCGTPITKFQISAFKPSLTKRGKIGLMLALIPGLFNVFGLGHFFFKKWSRGAMFLVFSAVMLYMLFIDKVDGIGLYMTIGISVVLYIIQAIEVLVLAYMPPKTTE